MNKDRYLYLPSPLYRVTATGGNVPSHKRGGQTYTQLDKALERKEELQWYGCDVRIFICYPQWLETSTEELIGEPNE